MFRSEIELKTKKCSLLTPDLQLVTLHMSQSLFREIQKQFKIRFLI